jgi:hypothetical protein
MAVEEADQVIRCPEIGCSREGFGHRQQRDPPTKPNGSRPQRATWTYFSTNLSAWSDQESLLDEYPSSFDEYVPGPAEGICQRLSMGMCVQTPRFSHNNQLNKAENAPIKPQLMLLEIDRGKNQDCRSQQLLIHLLPRYTLEWRHQELLNNPARRYLAQDLYPLHGPMVQPDVRRHTASPMRRRI